MNLQERIQLLVRLGAYMKSGDGNWMKARERAFMENHWFIPDFIELAVNNIADYFLSPAALESLVSKYRIAENSLPQTVGIVMAGNIPLVGFHDLICVFLSGHYAHIKPSSKDEVLVKHLVEKMKEWDPGAGPYFTISAMIRNCQAYIATGNNNSARYFDYYFSKYPSIIRRNRTSVAILTGNENEEELAALADDVYQFFGLGCRNVSKIYVPHDYDFLPLLQAFRKYGHLIHHHKYKNNYDYNLAMHILNNKYYMTNESILLVEAAGIFSPISQLHYEFYKDAGELKGKLLKSEDIQCIAGVSQAFGKAQIPGICDFADGVDTMAFLLSLNRKEMAPNV